MWWWWGSWWCDGCGGGVMEAILRISEWLSIILLLVLLAFL